MAQTHCATRCWQAGSTCASPIPARPKCISSLRSTASRRCAAYSACSKAWWPAPRWLRANADKPAATLLHLGPGLANGLANIHNARRANTPMINIIGDHASYHLKYDAPLTSDIEALARPMSHWVRTATGSDDVSASAAQAIAQARTPPGRIATLILPADAAWGETSAPLSNVSPSADRRQVSQDMIREAARRVRSGKTTVLLLTGVALRADALAIAGRIAKATGVRLLAQQSNGRMERGAGRVPIERVPYPVDQALAMLQDVEQMILVGSKAPVGFFAYPGKPSEMTPPGCDIWVSPKPATTFSTHSTRSPTSSASPGRSSPQMRNSHDRRRRRGRLMLTPSRPRSQRSCRTTPSSSTSPFHRGGNSSSSSAPRRRTITCS